MEPPFCTASPIAYGPLFANGWQKVTNLWRQKETMHATACHETTARSSVFLVLKCLGTFRFSFVCSPISRPFTCTMVGKPGSRSNSVMVICPCPSASILPWTNQAAEFLNSCPLHFPLPFAFHDFNMSEFPGAQHDQQGLHVHFPCLPCRAKLLQIFETSSLKRFLFWIKVSWSLS